MLKISKIGITLFLLLASVPCVSQNFTVTDFEESLQDVISTRVKDKNGNDCAVIKFSTEDKGFSVENAINSFESIGDMYVYVPEGTEVITIKHHVHRTLLYRIPIHIQSGCHYTANINIIDKNLIGKLDPDKFLYAMVGMNILSMMGPEVVLGYKNKSFCAELAFIYGLKKSDDIYFYRTGATIRSAYNYHPLRAAVRLGYSFFPTRHIVLTPQVGVAYNHITGSKIEDVKFTTNGYIDHFNTVSATLGARLTFNINSYFGLYVLPEYDFKISKDDNYDIVKHYDSILKDWTEGFNLSAGFICKF